MESGEYFLSASQKRSNAEKEKAESQKELLEAKKRKREEPYQVPKVGSRMSLFPILYLISNGSLKTRVPPTECDTASMQSQGILIASPVDQAILQSVLAANQKSLWHKIRASL